MKKTILVLSITTILLSSNSHAQLLIDNNGKAFVGPRITNNFDPENVLTMSVNGLYGEYRCGAKLAFGDFGAQASLGWNAFIGEFGTYDSDQLWLHGEKRHHCD